MAGKAADFGKKATLYARRPKPPREIFSPHSCPGAGNNAPRLSSGEGDDKSYATDTKFEAQQARIRELTLLLRNSYYKSNDKFLGNYPIPYGGNITESIGAWPEYILKGTFCKRSFNGLCSPCFYSRLPLNGHNREEYLSMIHKQCMHIVNNFKELVIWGPYVKPGLCLGVGTSINRTE